MKFDEPKKIILLWLWIGFGMILIQILLGGITRLTGSGLSITRWEIVTGILYPFGEEKWNYYFDLYKQTPQYQKINQDINLVQFKFIFFWEYLHRLWARLMGFIFLIPFLFFVIKKWLDKKLLVRLIIVFLLAVLVASLGWIMVASGLLQRPWVNAYKLSFHLIAAVTLLSYLFITIIKTREVNGIPERSKVVNIFLILLIGLIAIQIFIGGIMAGMKAGLIAPTWPKINKQWIPDQLFHLSSLYNYLFTEYEISHTGPLIIQFFHRTLAYIIFIVIISFSVFVKMKLKIAGLLLICLAQIILGIWTLIECTGYVPLWPAVLHQFLGVLLLIYVLWLYFTYESESKSLVIAKGQLK